MNGKAAVPESVGAMMRRFARRASAGWATYGGANLLMNIMAVVIISGGLFVLWSMIERPVPLESASVTSIDPEDRIIDRDKSDTFRITRTVCMSRGAWGTVTRYYVSTEGGGLEFRVAPNQQIFLPAGCHVRSAVMEVPAVLPPGRYVYRSSIEFCGRAGCRDGWVQDLPLLIRGGWPAPVPTGPAPMREPL